MDLQTAVASIRAYFETEWAAETLIVFDDQSYTPKPDTEFVRLNIRHSLGDQTTMGAPGNNRHQQEGGITVQIFTPQGNASIRARELADIAAAIFRGETTTDGIIFYETSPREVGNDGHGFYQINVNVRFRYDIFA